MTDIAPAKQKLTFVLFYGYPSVGKDTAGNALRDQIPGSVILSTGEGIREARKDPSHPLHANIEEVARTTPPEKNFPIQAIFDSQDPYESVMPYMILDALSQGATTLISTGFPRTMEQYKELQRYIADLNYDVDQKHIYLKVDPETVFRRMEKRIAEAIARGEAPRKDDKPEILEGRIKTFGEDTMPIIRLLNDEGLLHTINAEGTIDEVNALVRAELFPTPAQEISLPGRER
jgi:adenylate kinase family enzyme